MASPNINSDEDVTRAAGRSVSATHGKAIRSSPILRDQVFAEARSEDSATIKKRIIFTELVSEEGFTWILKEEGVFIKFLPKAVPDPRLVTCSLRKPGIVSPPLEDNESLVSNVIELDCDDPDGVDYSSIEVALTHYAQCLRGYELVMKEMIDTERWRDLETPEVIPSDLQGESSQWNTELPFVHAKVTSFSRYAVICRLKSYKIRKEDSGECSKIAVSVPDLPGACLSVPESSFPESMDFVVKEGENSIPPGSPSLRKLTVTFLASEWRSSRDGLSDIKRELAENMAKDPKVQVIFFVPKCDDEDKEEAKIQGVQLVEAGNNPVCDGLTCLNFLPVNSPIDVVVGHGIELAGPAQFIKWLHKCKWVQIVHEAHEEIGVFKECSNPITNAQKKHELEVKLCKESDFVVTIGPKLTETFRRSCEKDECFFEFTPGILAEFSGLKQDLKERKIFRVLCFVCGDPEDFKLKGLDIVAGAVAKLNDCHLVFVSLVDDKLKFKLEDTKQRLLECGLPHYQLRLRGLLDCRRSLEKELLEADLAVMPSRVEGFGVIGLQALSAGLPILVGRNSGLGEALMKVKFGSFFVVDSEDPEVWAKAIKNACHKDRTMRLQECEMLRELYKEVYSWEEQIESLINKFNKLIINSPSEVSGCSPSEHHTLIISVGPKQRKRKRKRQRKGSQAKMDLKRAKGKQKGEAQKEEELRQNLMREMAKRFIDECNDEIASEPFFQGLKYYLERELNLRIEQAVEGSLRIKVECRTLEILERLWEDYTSGHLNAEAEKRLLTDEIKRTYDVETIKLETIILREDYFACKLSFAGNIKVSFTDAKKSRIPLTGEMVPTSNDIKNGIHASDKDLTLFSDEKVTAVVTADTKSETTERTQKFPLVLTKGQIEETVSASPMPSPRDIDARRKIFDDTVGVISTETALLREQPSFCETSASVKSPVDDLGHVRLELFFKGRRSTSLLQSRNLTAEMACKNDKGFIKFLEESKNFTAQTEELRKLTFTQGMVTLIKSEIGNFYEDLGVLLGVREGDLDDIETRYSRPTEKGGAVLRNWKDREGPRATVGRLETALNRLGKKRIAVMLLDIAGEEKRTEDGSEEHRKTFSSPLEDTVRKEKRTESEQNGDRSEEHRKTFSSPLEARSVKGKLDDESKRVARLENERRNNLTKLKSQRADEPPRRQQNTGSNEPLKTI